MLGLSVKIICGSSVVVYGFYLAGMVQYANTYTPKQMFSTIYCTLKMHDYNFNFFLESICKNKKELLNLYRIVINKWGKVGNDGEESLPGGEM